MGKLILKQVFFCKLFVALEISIYFKEILKVIRIQMRKIRYFTVSNEFLIEFQHKFSRSMNIFLRYFRFNLVKTKAMLLAGALSLANCL
jgi:hypothetical protein